MTATEATGTAVEAGITDSIIMAEAVSMEMAEMGDSIMAAERISTIMEVVVIEKFRKKKYR